MLLTPAPRCPKDAVELVHDLSTILGATPHFMDADEHDGLIAATEGLPALLGAAVFYQLQEGRGWGDVQRMTNPAFGRLTHHLEDSHPDDLRDLLLNNRQNMLPVIDQLIASLQTFRTVLAENKRDSLEVALIESATEYNAWVSRRRRGRWEDTGETAKAANNNVMSTMMGGFLSRRLKRDKSDE
jgi:prephenate dehydrogenase